MFNLVSKKHDEIEIFFFFYIVFYLIITRKKIKNFISCLSQNTYNSLYFCSQQLVNKLLNVVCGTLVLFINKTHISISITHTHTHRYIFWIKNIHIEYLVKKKYHFSHTHVYARVNKNENNGIFLESYRRVQVFVLFKYLCVVPLSMYRTQGALVRVRYCLKFRKIVSKKD